MRKTLCALALMLAIGCPAFAGVIHTPPAPQPPPTTAGEIPCPPAPQGEIHIPPTAQGEMHTPAQVAGVMPNGRPEAMTVIALSLLHTVLALI